MILAARWFTFAVVALIAAVSMEPARYCATLIVLMAYGILSAVYGWEKHKEASLALLDKE